MVPRIFPLVAVWAVLIGAAIQPSYSKPLGYQLRRDGTDDANGLLRRAFLEEIANEMVNSGRRYSRADRAAILDELMPPPEYASDLIPARDATAIGYPVSSGKIEDERFFPGNRMHSKERYYDSDAGESRLSSLSYLPYESSQEEDGLPKKNFGLSDKELELLGLGLQESGAFQKNSHDENSLHSSRGNSHRNRLEKLPKSAHYEAQGKAKLPKSQKKTHAKSHKISGSSEKIVDKTPNEIVYKDGQPNASDKILKSDITGKESPVEMIIKEIEGIVIPHETKSSRKGKSQQDYGQKSNSLERSLNELKKHKVTNDPQRNYLESSALPLDQPMDEDFSALLREMRRLGSKQELKTRQTAGLPLDESIQKSAKSTPDLNSELSEEDIDFLIKVLQSQADGKLPANLDEAAEVPVPNHRNNLLGGADSKYIDALAKDFEQAWNDKDKQSENPEDSAQSSVNQEASLHIPNNKQDELPKGKEDSTLQQEDGLVNTIGNSEEGSMKESSDGLIDSAKAQQTEPLIGTEENIIKQIEARVAQLEERLGKQKASKNGVKRMARFRM